MKSSSHGFTLIELLVVIAIIGILAAIVLPALNDARQQAVDTKIKTEMDGIAKRASIEDSTALTYNTVCGSNGATQSSVVSGLITSIESMASSTVVCNSNNSAFAASVALDYVYWCVDSIGSRKEIPTALISTVGSEEFVCP